MGTPQQTPRLLATNCSPQPPGRRPLRRGAIADLAYEVAKSPQVGPSGPWQNKAPKGWQYEDKGGTREGVSQLQIKAGAQGKTEAQLKAKGINLMMPVPVDANRYFDRDPSVTVPLVSDEGLRLTTEHAFSK